MQKSGYVIGITGHRRLPPDSLSGLTAEVRMFCRDKSVKYGSANITVLSSIAEGADTLCANVALDENLRLIVPLPMPAAEYREDFSTIKAVAEFDRLLALADRVFVVSPEEPVPNANANEPSRGFWYRQAGIYVAKHCDALLAIWDGAEKDTPDGAGTWETIKLAKSAGTEIKIINI